MPLVILKVQTPGSNLPSFLSVQLAFADHIRNPQLNAPPSDIEPRRMKIYTDLFFNNIQNFLETTFPISKQIVGEARWLELAREFIHLHPSQSPYFLQISEEFLTFLYNRGLQGLPQFLLELCHYEWVELSLDVAADVAIEAHDAEGDLLGDVVLNPYVRTLAYEYPVHHIGPNHQPEPITESTTDAPSPTYLVVYRNTAEKVRFIESNPVTHRLLDLVQTQSGAQALENICEELSVGGRQVDKTKVIAQGLQTLTHLAEQGIVMGVRC